MLPNHKDYIDYLFSRARTQKPQTPVREIEELIRNIDTNKTPSNRLWYLKNIRWISAFVVFFGVYLAIHFIDNFDSNENTTTTIQSKTTSETDSRPSQERFGIQKVIKGHDTLEINKTSITTVGDTSFDANDAIIESDKHEQKVVRQNIITDAKEHILITFQDSCYYTFTSQILQTTEIQQPIPASQQVQFTNNKQPNNARESIVCIKWHPNNTNILFVKDSSNYIYDFSTISSKIERLFKGHTAAVTDVSCSPDSLTFISGAKDGSAIIWSYNLNLKQQQLNDAADGKIYKVDYSKNGHYVTTGSNGVTTLYKLFPIEYIIDYPLTYGGIHKQSPSSELTAIGYYDSLHIVNHYSTKGIINYKSSAIINTISWSPDSKLVALGLFNGNIEIVNSESGELQQLINLKTESPLYVSWNPNLDYLAAGYILNNNDTTFVLNPFTGDILYSNCGGYLPDWSWDGKSLAIGSNNGMIRVLKNIRVIKTNQRNIN